MATYIEGTDPIDDNSGIEDPNHSQDGSGRLHVVWRTLYDGGRLRYTRSDDGGATFSPAANLATKETFFDPIVEAAPSRHGVRRVAAATARRRSASSRSTRSRSRPRRRRWPGRR